MRIIAAFLFVFSALYALAQPSYTPLSLDPMVRHFCGAPQVSSGAEFDEVAAIARRLGVANPHIHVAVANTPVINAWDVQLSADASPVCVPVGLIYFMGKTEGELAFIIAHEIGHATDDRCKTLSGRASVANHAVPRTVTRHPFRARPPRRSRGAACL
jgi:Zn-dependent protease with chaperone function